MGREVIITTLWAGGWDEYAIDLDQTRQPTPDETNKQTVRVAAGHGADPIIGDRFEGNAWIWAYMISPKDRNDYNIEVNVGGIEAGQDLLYKVLRHINGGD